MKAKENYLISIYLKPEKEKSITVVWQQDFEPTLPEVLRKTVMHCVERKYASDLLDNPAKAMIRKVSRDKNIEEVANYNLSQEDLKVEFFDYIELSV